MLKIQEKIHTGLQTLDYDCRLCWYDQRSEMEEKLTAAFCGRIQVLESTSILCKDRMNKKINKGKQSMMRYHCVLIPATSHKCLLLSLAARRKDFWVLKQ